MVERDLVRWKRWMIDRYVYSLHTGTCSHRVSTRKTAKAEAEEANSMRRVWQDSRSFVCLSFRIVDDITSIVPT